GYGAGRKNEILCRKAKTDGKGAERICGDNTEKYLMETADIITLIGIIITAVLAGANLVTAFFNQRQSQGYNLRMADYERRYVQLTDNVSQYISMLDAHWLSFMALNEEEYEGKDAEIYERYHQMETAHYKIKLLLSN